MCRVTDVGDGNITIESCDDCSEDEDGWGTCSMRAEAEWLAQSDDEDARMNYERGVMRGAVNGDDAGMVRCLERAITGGHARALCELGQCYIMGAGVEEDLHHAVELFERGTAQGCPFTKCAFALVLFRGDFEPQNQARAIKLLEEACEGGNLSALPRLAEMLIKRSDTGFLPSVATLRRAEALRVQASTHGLRYAKKDAGLELCGVWMGYSDNSLGLRLVKEAEEEDPTLGDCDVAERVDECAAELLYSALSRSVEDVRAMIERGASVDRARNWCDAACCYDPRLYGCEGLHFGPDVKRGTEEGLGDTVLHIACRLLSAPMVALLFPLPEFDKMVLSYNDKGERPVDVVPGGWEQVRDTKTRFFVRDIARLTAMVSTTRTARAACLVWCFEQGMQPFIPLDLVTAIAKLILPPTRRHLEGPLNLSLAFADACDDDRPLKRRRC